MSYVGVRRCGAVKQRHCRSTWPYQFVVLVRPFRQSSHVELQWEWHETTVGRTRPTGGGPQTTDGRSDADDDGAKEMEIDKRVIGFSDPCPWAVRGQRCAHFATSTLKSVGKSAVRVTEDWRAYGARMVYCENNLFKYSECDYDTFRVTSRLLYTLRNSSVANNCKLGTFQLEKLAPTTVVRYLCSGGFASTIPTCSRNLTTIIHYSSGLKRPLAVRGRKVK